MSLALLALLGCPEAPDPLAGVTEPLQRECLVRHCAEVADLETCRAESCPRHETAWSLTPSTIGYDGQVIFLDAAVRYQAPGWGDVREPRTSPVFAGVTLVKADGEELDLAVQTRFEDSLEDPFFMSAEVGPDIEYVIMGLWDHKLEPCESERPGCKEFGFLLDGNLAVWPPTTYADGRKRRIPPAVVPLSVQLYGGDPGQLERLGVVASEALAGELALFKSTVSREATRMAEEIESEAPLVVRYGHPGDALAVGSVADRLAEDMGLDKVELQERGDGEARVEIVLVGPHHGCMVQHCMEAEDLPACFDAHCKG